MTQSGVAEVAAAAVTAAGSVTRRVMALVQNWSNMVRILAPCSKLYFHIYVFEKYFSDHTNFMVKLIYELVDTYCKTHLCPFWARATPLTWLLLPGSSASWDTRSSTNPPLASDRERRWDEHFFCKSLENICKYCKVWCIAFCSGVAWAGIWCDENIISLKHCTLTWVKRAQ